jgi:hypothetical protein
MIHIENFATPDGAGGYNLSPAAVLLIAGDTLYGDPSETTPDGLTAAARYVDAFLAAAVSGGFRKADILRTRMAGRETGIRLMSLAREAEGAAGPQRLSEVLQVFGES